MSGCSTLFLNMCSCGWGADVAQYLEAVVPAERVAEVAALVEPFFTVADLFSTGDEQCLQIVIMLEKMLTCKARFLYRYLQAARSIHGNLIFFCNPLKSYDTK